MNINRTIPTLIELSFKTICQIYNQLDNRFLETEEQLSLFVNIINQNSLNTKDFKFLRLLDNRSVTLGLPSKIENEITMIWFKFNQHYCLQNNNNKTYKTSNRATSECEVQDRLIPIVNTLKLSQNRLETFKCMLPSMQKSQNPIEIKSFIDSTRTFINASDLVETSLCDELKEKLALIEKNTEEKEKPIHEFYDIIDRNIQNVSKRLETKAFLYLSRNGDLLEKLEPITQSCGPLPYVLHNQILTTCTSLKEIHLSTDSSSWDAMQSLFVKIPSSVTSLEWIVREKPGLSNSQLLKITENCPLLEKVKLTLDESVYDDTLKAFLQKFSHKLINLHLECVKPFSKIIFQDLEFAQLKHVHLQVETFEEGALDTLKAPHLETLHLTFSQGNPVTQKLDQLKALNITCPEEFIDQILQNCLNIEALEIELNADKKLSLDHLKTVFFQMPYLKKFTDWYDVAPNIFVSLVKKIENAENFSSQLSLITFRTLGKDITKDELQDAFSKHHLNPNIVIHAPRDEDHCL